MVGRRGARAGLIGLLLVPAACDKPGGPAGSSGVSDTGEPPESDWDFGEPEIPWLADGAPGVAEPEIPWLDAGMPEVALPVFTPCPEGWRETTYSVLAEDDLVACEPWPETGPEDCEGVEVHIPGTAGCAPVGSDCPDGDWPEIEADWWVAPGGDGDGTSAEAPLGSLAEAAALGGTVAVAAGAWDEPLVLDGDVELVGACAERTVLAAPITVSGASLSLRDLSLQGIEEIAIQAEDATLVLRGVAVLGAVRTALRAEGTAVTLEEVAIREVEAGDDAAAEIGAVWVDGGSLDAARVELSDGWRAGFRIANAEASLADVVVHAYRGAVYDDADTYNGLAGGGVAVDLRWSTVGIERLVAYDVSWCGVRSWAGDLSISDVVVSDVLPLSDETYKATSGLCIYGDSDAVVQRAVVHDTTWAGLVSKQFAGVGEQTSIEASDLLIYDLGDSEDEDGSGIRRSGMNEASGSISRAVLMDLTYMAISLDGQWTFEDIVVKGIKGIEGSTGAINLNGGDHTLSRVIVTGSAIGGIAVDRRKDAEVEIADLYVGAGDTPLVPTSPQVGIWVAGWMSGQVEVQRALFEGMADAGIAVQEDEGRLTATDMVVRGAGLSGAEGRAGVGAWVSDTGRLSLERVRFEDMARLGVGVDLDSEASLVDVSIASTEGSPVDGSAGVGLWVREGALDLSRVELRDAHLAGLWSDFGTVQAEDVLVSGMRQAVCYPQSCDDPAAAGVVLDGGTASLSRFLLADGAGAGLQVAAGQAELADVLSTGNTVGYDQHGGYVQAVRIASEGDGAVQGELVEPLPEDLGSPGPEWPF